MNETMRLRSFYLPNKMYENLRGIAGRSDYNISEHVRAALEQYIAAALEAEAAVAPVPEFPAFSDTPGFAGDPPFSAPDR